MATKGYTAKGKKRKEYGTKWIGRVESSTKLERDWLDDASIAQRAYTNERKEAADSSILGQNYDYNILFSNVETIVPAVINSPPVPDIRRRFNDPDPAARLVCDLMERAIRVQIDDSRLQVELEGAAQDAFLAGRGLIRIRFKSDIKGGEPTDEELLKAEDDDRDDIEPSVGTATPDARTVGPSGEVSTGDQYAGQTGGRGIGDNGGPPLERLENERICYEAVSWKDYRHGPAARWEDRQWDAFRFSIPREDEKDSFDVAMIDSQLDDADRKARSENENDLTGWEIWCIKTKTVYFIDDNGVVLKEVKDPLGLKTFFPIPTPMQPIDVVGRLRPVNPFMIYAKLADELDTITKRLNRLIVAMKVKGWYIAAAEDLASVVSLEDNEFVPIAADEAWAQAGGIEGAMAFWPIEKFAAVIKELYLARDQTKAAIYEITGISDIVRGASMASETATAQNIKSQWGSLRIQKMQRMLERHARDLFVMSSEIIASKFSRETLEKMTGIPLIPQPNMAPEQLAQIQAVNKLLDDGIGTYFRVDVESDSTVRADLTRQKQEASEFLQGSGAYFAAVGPLLQQGMLSPEVALEIYSANARLFNLGKSVEDALEKMGTEARAKAEQAKNAPPPPDPEAIKAEQENGKLQVEQQRTATEAETAKADNQVKLMTAQQKATEDAYKLQLQQQKDQESLRQTAAEFDQKLDIALQDAQTADRAKLAEIAIKEMDRAIREIDKQIKETDLQIKQVQLAKESVEAPEEPEIDAETGETIVKPDPIAVLTEAITAMSAAHAAPKEIVRDPKTGKAIGVRPVMSDG